MGVFDFIGRKYQEAKDEMQKAEMEAETWYPEQICNVLERTSSISKITGYQNELRRKAKDMSIDDLKCLFDYAWNKRNVKACKALYTIMEEEGLCYKEDDGKIRRNY